MESLMSENSFDMTTSMINSDLMSHSSVYGSLESPIVFRDAFVDEEDLFNAGTVNAASVEGASMSTRLRRRKASQPQRVRYPESELTTSDSIVLNSNSNDYTTPQQVQVAMVQPEGLFKCPSCDVRFDAKSCLRSHMKSSHGPEDANKKKCGICGVGFLNSSALERHQKRMHEKSECTFHCDLCSKKFLTKAELTQHSSVHSLEKKFTCDHCDKKFACRAYLDRHTKTHLKVKAFQCEICHKYLGDKTGFLAHVRAHKGEKPFQCEICNKRYTIKRLLTSHMRTHSTSRPFACEFPGCTKTFRSRSNFRMHKDFHAGVKRWSCSFCGRSFLSQGNMAKHVRRRHVGDKKFVCLVCDKKFFDKKSLNNHERVHTVAKEDEAAGEINASTNEPLLTEVNNMMVENVHESPVFPSNVPSYINTCTGEVMIMVDGQSCTVLDAHGAPSIPLNRNSTFAYSDFTSETCVNDQSKVQSSSISHLDYNMSDQMLYNCPLCSYTFPVESSRLDHLIDYHRVEPAKIH